MDTNLIIDEYRRERAKYLPKPDYGHERKVWLYTGMFEQNKFYEIATQSFLLYGLFRSYIVRGNGKSSLYKRVKSKYYDNGDLVCALSYSEIVKKTGWYRSKISRYIDDLVENGFIRIGGIDVGKRHKQQIYILGRTYMGEERYFIDEIISES